MSSLRESRASRGPSPENAKARPMSETSGQIPFAVYKKSDPNTSFSKMSLGYSPQDVRLAYVAGLIDGEGHIGITCRKSLHYSIEVSIGMTEKARPLLEAMRLEFHGTLYEKKLHSMIHTDQLKWRIGGVEASGLLARLMPYLMLKQRQAEIAVSLIVMRDAHGWTAQTRKQAKAMKRQIHVLNKKGPDAQVAGQGWYSPQQDLFYSWKRFSGPWPAWGSLHLGACWELPTLAPRTSASGSGYEHGDNNAFKWQLDDSGRSGFPLLEQMEMETAQGMVCLQDHTAGQHPDAQIDNEPSNGSGNRPHKPQEARQQTSESSRGRTFREPPQPKNENAGCDKTKWPEQVARANLHKGEDNLLGQFLRPQRSAPCVSESKATIRPMMWPTPTAGDGRRGSTGWIDDGKRGGQLPSSAGGPLNPTWVGYYLMGFPLDWESLDPLSANAIADWIALHAAGWPEEPPIPCVAMGIKNRVARLKALGNAEVPAVAALAWRVLGT